MPVKFWQTIFRFGFSLYLITYYSVMPESAPQYLANQLTLFQPGEGRLSPTYYNCPLPIFSPSGITAVLYFPLWSFYLDVQITTFSPWFSNFYIFLFLSRSTTLTFLFERMSFNNVSTVWEEAEDPNISDAFYMFAIVWLIINLVVGFCVNGLIICVFIREKSVSYFSVIYITMYLAHHLDRQK